MKRLSQQLITHPGLITILPSQQIVTVETKQADRRGDHLSTKLGINQID